MNGGVKIHLMGAGKVDLGEIPILYQDWNEADEIEFLQQIDVGIMPLPDESWARGKCGLKLIQYMACSIPVVASPVGVSGEIVDEGVNGFLAESTEQWITALNRLKGDAGMRDAMGQAGREKVERQYSLQLSTPRLSTLLSSVIEAS